MPVFKYKGYSQDGASTEGIIEADGQRDAAARIKSKGIFPKEITESQTSKKKHFINRFSPQVLSDITRRLSTLISSGVPLLEGISAISNEQKGPSRNILTDIKERIASGTSLSRSLQAYPDIFPDFYTGMIAAGEKSGRLSDVLLKLADFLERDITVKSRVRTALVYPAFMASISIVIIFFLFTFVIPKITKIFDDTSAALPFITVVLLWINTALHKFWWLFLAMAAAALMAFKRVRERRRDIIDSLLLKEPTGLLMELYMLRFTMTMSFLLSGGLPILNAMQLTARATGNVALEKTILTAQEHVSQGAKLSASLESFPPTLLQIISTGEQTGKLPEVLMKTSESYENEFDKKLQRMISLLEPSLILIMGLIVGLIVIAVLLPIFELNQLMQ